MIRNLSLLVCIFLAVGSSQAEKPRIGGTIHFEDGTKEQFFSLDFLQHVANVSAAGHGTTSLFYFEAGQLKEIPFSELQVIEVKLYEVHLDRWRIPTLSRVTLRVRRSGKEEFLVDLEQLRQVEVQILDQETGELTSKTIPFTKDGKLNIRRLVLWEQNMEKTLLESETKPDDKNKM